ncbi:MAG: LytTR family transcriptional regulator [Clostridia bacterium]|nr:LytTR family transcriptional regulator [Clostridia bacterium]
MKYRIEFSETQNEDIVLIAREKSPTLLKIEAIFSESERTVFGYEEDRVVRLAIAQITAFTVEDAKVYALTAEGKFRVKDRLYRLEEVFADTFVKINQSCLVNIAHIERFDATIGGALSVTLKGGYRDYISRRQLRTVKERIGF